MQLFKMVAAGAFIFTFVFLFLPLILNKKKLILLAE